MIGTKHLLIRKFRSEDLEDVHLFLSHPAAMAFSGLAPFSFGQSAEWLNNHMEAYPKKEPLGVFAIENRQTHRVIGYCGLENLPLEIADDIEVTIGLVPEFWGRGYAKEAVSALIDYARDRCRLERIVAVVHAENLNAHHLFQNCGFRRHCDLVVDGVGQHSLYRVEITDIWENTQ